MRRLFTSIAFLVLGLGLVLPEARPADLAQPRIITSSREAAPTFKVLRVVDGDTVILKMDGKTIRARLIGVDTPETVHPGKPVERFGKEATLFLRRLIEGKSVRVAYEDGVSRLDRYGRLLVYLYLDDLLVNREIIAKGYGHAYTQFPFRYMEDFRLAERSAREGQVGLWAPEPPPAPIPFQAPPKVVDRPPSKSVARPNRNTVARAQSSDDTQSVTVYITRTGAKYHTGSCRYLAKSKIATSLTAAMTRYTACSVCDPPSSAVRSLSRSYIPTPPRFVPRASPGSTGSSTSSLCGAPTKKGGSCKRRVSGGGYCYQHR